MVSSRGAVLSPEEYTAVLAYLVREWGPAPRAADRRAGAGTPTATIAVTPGGTRTTAGRHHAACWHAAHRATAGTQPAPRSRRQRSARDGQPPHRRPAHGRPVPAVVPVPTTSTSSTPPPRCVGARHTRRHVSSATARRHAAGRADQHPALVDAAARSVWQRARAVPAQRASCPGRTGVEHLHRRADGRPAPLPARALQRQRCAARRSSPSRTC